jgi:hypothetical protein
LTQLSRPKYAVLTDQCGTLNCFLIVCIQALILALESTLNCFLIVCIQALILALESTSSVPRVWSVKALESGNSTRFRTALPLSGASPKQYGGNTLRIGRNRGILFPTSSSIGAQQRTPAVLPSRRAHNPSQSRYYKGESAGEEPCHIIIVLRGGV